MRPVLFMSRDLALVNRALDDRRNLCKQQLQSPIAKRSDEFQEAWADELDRIIALQLALHGIA